MSLLSVIRDVSLAVGVNPPVSMFSPSVQPRTQGELLSLANEMAQRIAYDTREWGRLKVVGTFTGDGTIIPPPPDPTGVLVGTTMFDLPANFKRMLLTANVWRSSNTQTPMVFISDADEWLNRRARGWISGLGEWTILGGQMHISPVMPVGENATYAYLDKNCIALGSGGTGDAFMTDADTFLLGDRLLKLGMIWQWKANKGSPYAEDMGTYSDALTMAMGSDQPAPIIIGSGRLRGNQAYTGVAPWPL
jgi:hypothetical protein